MIRYPLALLAMTGILALPHTSGVTQDLMLGMTLAACGIAYLVRRSA